MAKHCILYGDECPRFYQGVQRSYSQVLGFKTLAAVFAIGPALGHISELEITLYWSEPEGWIICIYRMESLWSELFGSVGIRGMDHPSGWDARHIYRLGEGTLNQQAISMLAAHPKNE